jgi:uncharacterized protein (TIGR03905 family)
MKTNYKTTGTCSVSIDLDIEDGIIREVAFERGCNGNGKAISALVKDMNAQDAIARLKNINCGNRGTSCGDQLAKAIEAQIKA